MNRAPLLALGLGLLGLIVLALLTLFGPTSVVPSDLSAWLFLSALPLGALPLVMVVDLLGLPETRVSAALRALLPVMPLAAILAIPLLLDAPAAAAPAGASTLLAMWMSPGAQAWRMVVFLLVWVVLAFLFWRRPLTRARKPGPAVTGLLLMLHLFIETIAADDLLRLLDSGLDSSSFGLLLMLAQCSTAFAAAWLLAGPARGVSRLAGASLMLGLIASWLFVHFVQYLVVWSANLPGEVGWYIHRDSGLGLALELIAVGVFLLSFLGLLPGIGLRVVTGVAVAILLVHLFEMLWLVVPASRGSFRLVPLDALAVVSLLALLGGATLMLRAPSLAQGDPHGRT